MINAGAMLLCALLKPELSLTHKVDFVSHADSLQENMYYDWSCDYQVLQKFCRMAGEPERSIKCDIMTCDSEMDTAHRNYALLHYMKSKEARCDVTIRV